MSSWDPLSSPRAQPREPAAGPPATCVYTLSPPNATCVTIPAAATKDVVGTQLLPHTRRRRTLEAAKIVLVWLGADPRRALVEARDTDVVNLSGASIEERNKVPALARRIFHIYTEVLPDHEFSPQTALVFNDSLGPTHSIAFAPRTHHSFAPASLSTFGHMHPVYHVILSSFLPADAVSLATRASPSSAEDLAVCLVQYLPETTPDEPPCVLDPLRISRRYLSPWAASRTRVAWDWGRTQSDGGLWGFLALDGHKMQLALWLPNTDARTALSSSPRPYGFPDVATCDAYIALGAPPPGPSPSARSRSHALRSVLSQPQMAQVLHDDFVLTVGWWQRGDYGRQIITPGVEGAQKMAQAADPPSTTPQAQSAASMRARKELARAAIRHPIGSSLSRSETPFACLCSKGCCMTALSRARR
ncbi:hypothetical protein PHLGIDRAFT_12718 [Phlebiopsis gigantea 11061_1 CR5-6]|uniref:Uncharacterized protein n=1 Tax=Phlebiopsis gigantea (strain 11061_1 CR5-6) TaxID=745531 RepID=A0A0C3PN48_PHLG1|nr:hypothetical protein PHLGIDRAFT_12718 [Phlebiopsis gigantea 11061_1 CR5-6]